MTYSPTHHTEMLKCRGYRCRQVIENPGMGSTSTLSYHCFGPGGERLWGPALTHTTARAAWAFLAWQLQQGRIN